MTGPDPSTAKAKPLLPWWREPIAIGIFSFVVLASSAVLMQGYFIHPKTTDTKKNSPIPGGGTFCDPPAPVNSTAYNPSTQKSPPKEESQAPF
jgi:hypothetical protein